MLDHADLDVVLTYNHYTLQNDSALQLVPICEARRVGLINAAPFSARLLSNATLPPWHKSTPEVREVAANAAAHCRDAGSDIAKLALQFSVACEDFASCVSGSASPERIAQWCDWIEEPIDTKLLAEVKEILKPIHNWTYPEGLPENDETQSA
jgi:aryl-alcohol dehydrogenase-like predicted oxidoreductase